MKQILFIHGGDSFLSQAAYLADLKARQMDYARLLPKQRWTNTLAAEFPAADILLPTMPNPPMLSSTSGRFGLKKFCRFSARNHFLDPEFPEIIENLKK